MIADASALHLVDPDGPGASRWLCALARNFAGAPIVTLGSRGTPWAQARVPVPGGSAALAARALERLSDAWGVEGVVAWGSRAAEVAVRARDAAQRMLVLDDAPAGGTVAFDAELVCVGDACADRVCARGWPPMRVRVLQPPQQPGACPVLLKAAVVAAASTAMTVAPKRHSLASPPRAPMPQHISGFKPSRTS